jgi:hypothetical protein
MDRESADSGLAAFAKAAGMLFDAGAAAGLTADGGKFFGQALGKQ